MFLCFLQLPITAAVPGSSPCPLAYLCISFARAQKSQMHQAQCDSPLASSALHLPSLPTETAQSALVQCPALSRRSMLARFPLLRLCLCPDSCHNVFPCYLSPIGCSSVTIDCVVLHHTQIELLPIAKSIEGGRRLAVVHIPDRTPDLSKHTSAIFAFHTTLPSLHYQRCAFYSGYNSLSRSQTQLSFAYIR